MVVSGQYTESLPGGGALPPVPIIQGTGWAPGPVWTGPENLAPTGIRSPDRLASCYSDWAISAHISI